MKAVRQFGFDVTTCCGYLPQMNDWLSDWAVRGYSFSSLCLSSFFVFFFGGGGEGEGLSFFLFCCCCLRVWFLSSSSFLHAFLLLDGCVDGSFFPHLFPSIKFFSSPYFVLFVCLCVSFFLSFLPYFLCLSVFFFCLFFLPSSFSWFFSFLLFQKSY